MSAYTEDKKKLTLQEILLGSASKKIRNATTPLRYCGIKEFKIKSQAKI